MDFDDAYANAAYIPGGETYPGKWAEAGAAFRATARCALDLAYGDSLRQRLDLFLPDAPPKGLIVFVHGGYWLRFDKSFWSHLAAGPLAHGWSVAMPSYDLCPQVRISQIGAQAAAAISFAASKVEGPIRLIGHSAGGQLVARVTGLSDTASWQGRLEKIVSVSPVSDLAPLMRTTMNKDLQLTPEEALQESPVHLPAPDVPVSVWVGADERPVFLDQAKWLVDAWGCQGVVADGRNHFTIIEELEKPDSALTRSLFT